MIIMIGTKNQKKNEFVEFLFHFFLLAVGFLLGIVITFAVISKADFFISPESIETTVATHSFGFLGPAMINSTFNETVDLQISYSGDALPFFLLKNTTKAFANTTTEFYFNYFIPYSAEPKRYDAVINFSFNETVRSLNIKINVYDNIKPEFKRCSIEPAVQNQTKNITLSCSVSDNIKVSRVYAFISGPETREIDLNELEREFQAVFSFQKIGKYNMVVLANDSSNNIASYDNMTFEIVEWIPLVVNDINFGKVKFLQMHERKIGYLSERADINVSEKIGFVLNVSGNISSYLKLADGRREILTEEEKEFKDAPEGDLMLEIYSDTMVEASGRVVFSIMGKNLYSSVWVNFTYYSIPMIYNYTWLGNPAYCYPVDTGSYETSYKICELRLSIDSNIGENAGILPISFLEQYNPSSIITLEKRVSSQHTLIIILFVVSILLFLGGATYILWSLW